MEVNLKVLAKYANIHEWLKHPVHWKGRDLTLICMGGHSYVNCRILDVGNPEFVDELMSIRCWDGTITNTHWYNLIAICETEVKFSEEIDFIRS